MDASGLAQSNPPAACEHRQVRNGSFRRIFPTLPAGGSRANRNVATCGCRATPLARTGTNQNPQQYRVLYEKRRLEDRGSGGLCRAHWFRRTAGRGIGSGRDFSLAPDSVLFVGAGTPDHSSTTLIMSLVSSAFGSDVSFQAGETLRISLTPPSASSKIRPTWGNTQCEPANNPLTLPNMCAGRPKHCLGRTRAT